MSDPGSAESFWLGRTVAITGAGGFVGAWLAHALAGQGARVLAMARPGGHRSPILNESGSSIVINETSLFDLDGLAIMMSEHDVSAVFHLAADNDNRLQGQSPVSLFESNVRATYMLFEACRLAGMDRIVATTSREADALAVDRDANLQPYAASKISLEVIARSYRDTYGLPVALIKPDNVYGGGDLNFRRLIPWAINELLHGRPLKLKRAAAIAPRGYLYVEDLAAGLMAAAIATNRENPPKDIFSLEAPEAHSVDEVLQLISERFGSKCGSAPLARTAPRQQQRLHALIPTIAFPGYKPSTRLQAGLDATMSWYKANKAKLDQRPAEEQRP